MTRSDDLIDAILCGDLAPDDPAVLARRAADADFDRELQSLTSVQGTLDAASQMERDVVAEAESPRTRIGWLVAAAALIVAVLTVLELGGGKEPGGRFLGGEVRVTATAEDGFAISFSLPAQGYFTIEVTDVDGRRVHKVPRWTTSEWAPDRTEWPDVVTIQVLAYDGQGEFIGDGTLEFTR